MGQRANACCFTCGKSSPCGAPEVSPFLLAWRAARGRHQVVERHLCQSAPVFCRLHRMQHHVQSTSCFGCSSTARAVRLLYGLGRPSAWLNSSAAASVAAVEPESCTQLKRDAFVCKCFGMIKVVRSSLLKLGAEVSPAAVVDQQWLSRTAVFMKFRRCAVNNLNRDCS